MTAPVRFSIVGAGWRAAFFLRIAALMPERFVVTGLVTRDAERGVAIEAQYGVSTRRRIEDIADPGAFTVVSVAQRAAPEVVAGVAARGMPVLAETPPAPDLEGLLALWRLVEGGARIQVAEQYVFQPMHAARLSVVRAGWLGRVSQAQVSVAHGYHAVSLLRHFLGAGFAPAVVTARTFTSPLVAGPDRAGPPSEERQVESAQVLAQLDFGDRLGVHDFAAGQYFSWIRAPRLLVRGERGELKDNEVRCLQDFRTPVRRDLRRVDLGQDGNLEGMGLAGVLAGDAWVYRCPFPSARLSDEEIAIATVLEGMAGYVGGRPPVYSFADAAQDQYLALCVEEARQTGAAVRTAPQPWHVG